MNAPRNKRETWEVIVVNKEKSAFFSQMVRFHRYSTHAFSNKPFFIYYMHKQFSKDKYLNLFFHPLIDDNRLLKKGFAVEFSSEHEKDN